MKKDKKNSGRNREMISDCLAAGGGVAVSIGIGLLHVAAGIIAAGLLAMAFAWLISRGGE